MIAFNEPCSAPSQAWQIGFLALLPAIREHARIAFRSLKPEARDDAIQEVTANACVAYARLVQLGKRELAYPSALTRFAVKHYWSGRRTGSSLNSGDVLCRDAQRRRGFDVERLDGSHAEGKAWAEALADNTRSPVPDQAAFRIAFPAWLATQSRRDRRLARFLARGQLRGRSSRPVSGLVLGSARFGRSFERVGRSFKASRSSAESMPCIWFVSYA